MSCGAKKLSGTHRADELYIGQYHKMAMAYAKTFTNARVLILSSKYGLVEPHEMIESYEQRMGQPGTVSVQRLRLQAEQLGLGMATRVTVVGGKKYVAAVQTVWPTARSAFLFVRGGMGSQMKYMKEWVDAQDR